MAAVKIIKVDYANRAHYQNAYKMWFLKREQEMEKKLKEQGIKETNIYSLKKKLGIKKFASLKDTNKAIKYYLKQFVKEVELEAAEQIKMEKALAE